MKVMKVVLTVLLGISLPIVILSGMFTEKVTTYYEQADKVYKNPLMGFAPAADYIEAVGDNTLVTLNVTWREVEPEENEFAFDEIKKEYNLERWRNEGKRVVFRFICDNPSDEKHMDIPDWLYEKTGDGTFYDCDYGKGYSPDYSNDTFIKEHDKVIRAIGNEFGKDDFFCYIELGSLGHWGEWHVKYDEGIKRMPTEEICGKYVAPYVKAFPNSKLLMRRPFSFVSKYGMGVYNDMTGDAEATEEWLEWISDGGDYNGAAGPIKLYKQGEIWKKSPIGGEFTSGYPMSELLGEKLEDTVALIQKSHMTFAGPMCPIAKKDEKKNPEAVSKILNEIGYKYGVSESRLIYNKLLKASYLKFKLENTGVAPMYYDWKLCIYELDDNSNITKRYATNVKLSDISSGESEWISVTLKGNNWKNGIVKLGIGIEDPATGQPAVNMNMKERSGDILKCIV